MGWNFHFMVKLWMGVKQFANSMVRWASLSQQFLRQLLGCVSRTPGAPSGKCLGIYNDIYRVCCSCRWRGSQRCLHPALATCHPDSSQTTSPRSSFARRSHLLRQFDTLDIDLARQHFQYYKKVGVCETNTLRTQAKKALTSRDQLDWLFCCYRVFQQGGDCFKSNL